MSKKCISGLVSIFVQNIDKIGELCHKFMKLNRTQNVQDLLFSSNRYVIDSSIFRMRPVRPGLEGVRAERKRSKVLGNAAVWKNDFKGKKNEYLVGIKEAFMEMQLKEEAAKRLQQAEDLKRFGYGVIFQDSFIDREAEQAAMEKKKKKEEKVKLKKVLKKPTKPKPKLKQPILPSFFQKQQS